MPPKPYYGGKPKVPYGMRAATEQEAMRTMQVAHWGLNELSAENKRQLLARRPHRPRDDPRYDKPRLFFGACGGRPPNNYDYASEDQAIEYGYVKMWGVNRITQHGNQMIGNVQPRLLTKLREDARIAHGTTGITAKEARTLARAQADNRAVEDLLGQAADAMGNNPPPAPVPVAAPPRRRVNRRARRPRTPPPAHRDPNVEDVLPDSDDDLSDVAD